MEPNLMVENHSVEHSYLRPVSTLTSPRRHRQPRPNPSPSATTASAWITAWARRRNHPVISLLSVLLLFLASGFGVCFSALALLWPEPRTDAQMVSRLLLLSTSSFGVVYVALHLLAARAGCQRYEKSPYRRSSLGYWIVLQSARLGALAWFAMVILAAFDFEKITNADTDIFGAGLRGSAPWASLVTAGIALISTIFSLLCIEMSECPFAMFLVSKKGYIQGERARKSDFAEGNVWFGFQVQVSRPGSQARCVEISQKLSLATTADTFPTGKMDLDEHVHVFVDAPRIPPIGPPPSPPRAQTIWRTSHPFSSRASTTSRTPKTSKTPNRLTGDDGMSSVNPPLYDAPVTSGLSSLSEAMQGGATPANASRSSSSRASLDAPLSVLLPTKTWQGSPELQSTPRRTVTNFSRKRGVDGDGHSHV